MKGKLFFSVVFLLCSFKVFSQQFYVCTSSGELQQVTITSSGPVSQVIPGCGTGDYFSIAFLKNKIYYNTASGMLYSADLTPGSAPSVSNCKLIATGVASSALTIDKQGVLYMVSGNDLYSLDPENPTAVYLGTMPYYSAGDLAFYNNTLYLAAPEGIVSVNLKTPSKSTLAIPIVGSSIFGLTTFTFKGQNVLYALTAAPLGTDLLELDMQNNTVKGSVGTLPYIAYDAGSETESGAVVTGGPVDFPNAFTPNNDGINDIFKANQDTGPANFKLVIYNRWGTTLFQSQNITNGWDGKYSGGTVPAGTYYWIATYKMADNKTYTKSGYVLLVR